MEITLDPKGVEVDVWKWYLWYTAYFSTYHKQNRWSHNLLSRFFSPFFCSCNRKHDTFSLFILARRISLLVNPIAINQDFNCTALLVKKLLPLAIDMATDIMSQSRILLDWWGPFKRLHLIWTTIKMYYYIFLRTAQSKVGENYCYFDNKYCVSYL